MAEEQSGAKDKCGAKKKSAVKKKSGAKKKSAVKKKSRAKDESGAKKQGGSVIRDKAIAFVRDAVKEDQAGSYEQAFKLYVVALGFFGVYLKYEKNPRMKETVTQKYKEYLARAEELQKSVQTETETKNLAGEVHNRRGADIEEDGELAEIDRLFGFSIVKKPNLKWEDVAVVQDAKDALMKVIICLEKFPHFFAGKIQPKNRILLYGPPGAGKSSLAKAAATKSGSTFFSISSVDLLSAWGRCSGKDVSRLFALARQSSPAIIFIDEVDALCGESEGGREPEVARCIKEELSKLQGSGCCGSEVLVLGATNMPLALNQAMNRCFDQRIYIPLPDGAVRTQILRMNIGETPSNLTDDDYRSISAMTEGFSGSDMKHVVTDALHEPIRRTQNATHFITFKNAPHIPNSNANEHEESYAPCSPDEPGAWPSSLEELARLGYATRVLPPPVTIDDFRTVLLRTRPAVSVADLKTYDQFTREVGDCD